MSGILEWCKIFAVLLLLAGILLYGVMLLRAFIFGNIAIREILNKSPLYNYGLPFSALAAFAIVSILEFAQPDKSLTFKAFNLSFEGPAAPVTLWVVCFVVFVWAMGYVAKVK